MSHSARKCVALATCTDLPGWEKDDRSLHLALETFGVPFEIVAWDKPSEDWSRFDGVLIRTTWDYMERVDAYTAWAHEVGQVTRLFNPAKVWFPGMPTKAICVI